MSKHVTTAWGLAIVMIISSLFVLYLSWQSQSPFKQGWLSGRIIDRTSGQAMAKFSSAEDFKKYLEESSSLLNGYFGSFNSRSVAKSLPGAITLDLAQGEIAAPAGVPEIPSEPLERFSETNVQVSGIDEPDIVKTDGQEIFFSPTRYYYYERMMPIAEDFMPPRPEEANGILAIKALPPTNLQKSEIIAKNGDLLLKNNTLVVFEQNQLTAYDVKNPQAANEKWQVKLANQSRLLTARLFQDKIYLITGQAINYQTPCPIIPLKSNGQDLSIPCGSIYHPTYPAQSDTTYNISVIDLSSGQTTDAITFVGSADNSVIYMSPQSIYVTYLRYPDFISFFLDYARENVDLFPIGLIEKLSALNLYDISQEAKMTEFQIILEKHFNSLTKDERLRLENELNNRAEIYQKKHARDLEKTGIYRINLNGLEFLSSGEVPGRILNQFSIDEFDQHLRIATTVGGLNANFFGRSESANDVYVLDQNLKITGAIKDLGLTEKIYAARFIGDRGYLVTFRQTDPFYILDLKNPKAPQKTGELKIPGFSSYLHPLKENRILGVGEENGQVKLSLFDVQDPAQPQELSKYLLNEYWSEVAGNHHAFLQDSRHQAFFLPAGQNGYIFSYENDQLALKKASSDIAAKRAVFINDYLYIIGENKLTVLDEKTWETIGQLDY